MRSFRCLLGISYKERITNEEVRSRIRKAIGPYEELLPTVKRRKMKWYGHVTRASRLAKTVLLTERHREESEGTRGMVNVGCQVVWCPNGPQDYGIDR